MPDSRAMHTWTICIMTQMKEPYQKPRDQPASCFRRFNSQRLKVNKGFCGYLKYSPSCSHTLQNSCLYLLCSCSHHSGQLFVQKISLIVERRPAFLLRLNNCVSNFTTKPTESRFVTKLKVFVTNLFLNAIAEVKGTSLV